MKHSAYVFKNIAWWLMYVPFCASLSWQDNLRACIMLALVGVIYILRAKTEENHLSQYHDYRLYSRWIHRFGLWATMKNTLRLFSQIRTFR